jgi:hypothetical protein
MTDKTAIEYDINPDLVNPKDENPDPTKMTDKTAIEYDINPDLVNPKDENPDPTKMTDKTDATDETETTGISDTKSTGTKAEGTKVYINGQLCIKMPNGEVYNAGTGQRIE